MKNKMKVEVTLLTTVSGGKRTGVKRKVCTVKKDVSASHLPRRLKKRLKRLQKQTAMLFLSLLLLFTVGCGRLDGYTEPEDIAVVSAIGFDRAEDGVRVSFQSVEDGGRTLSVTSGEGGSVSLALSSLYGGGAKRYELSHLALVVIGEELSDGIIDEIFSFCEERKEVSDAVLWVSTEDAAGFLSLENAAGYDIASAMRPYPEGSGLFSRNRFYEIRSEEISGGGEKWMALPHLVPQSGDYYLDGVKLYRDRGEYTILDRFESVLYLMMRGIFTSGQVRYTCEGVGRSVSVTKCRVDARDGEVSFSLFLKERLPESEKTAFLMSCRNGAQRLYEKLGAAPFGYDGDRGKYVFCFEIAEDGNS